MYTCRIPRYSQRLKILYFIKTRDERLGDIEPRVQSVLHSCSEVISSGKLCKVLEVVLAFGNFMNQGRRGNAFGFKLSSLNNILDTKSSIDREVTLLHYIIKTLESKVNASHVSTDYIFLAVAKSMTCTWSYLYNFKYCQEHNMSFVVLIVLILQRLRIVVQCALISLHCFCCCIFL